MQKIQFKNNSYNNRLYLIFFLVLSIFIIFYSLITIPIHPDDGNILKESKYFERNGFDRGYKTLTPIIPVVLYYMLELYEIPVMILPAMSTIFFIVSIFLLIKLFFNYRFPIVLIFLFPIIFERSLALPPYPEFMFLFTLSLYLFIKATQIKNKQNISTTLSKEQSVSFFISKLYILSALLLSLAIYTFTLALILCVVPFFYLIFTKLDRNSKFRIFIKYYFCLFLFLFPWLYWHFKIGGLKYFYYSPLNWYIVKALPIVNKYFWGYGSIPFLDLLRLYFQLLVPNILLIPCLFFVIIGLLNYSKFKTPIKFSILWLIFYFPVLAFLGVSAFPRYFYLLVIPLIIISSAGLIIIRKHSKKLISFALSGILGFGILFNTTSYFSNRQVENRFRPSTSLDAKKFSGLINDDKNIFSRHYGFQYIFANNFITQVDMKEEEALKLLSWSSEEDVKEILKKYNIGWIMFYNNAKRWEHDFYVWVNVLYGKEPIYYDKVKESNMFKKVGEGKMYSLYKVIDE